MFLSAVCKKGVWGRGSLVQFAALNRMLIRQCQSESRARSACWSSIIKRWSSYEQEFKLALNSYSMLQLQFPWPLGSNMRLFNIMSQWLRSFISIWVSVFLFRAIGNQWPLFGASTKVHRPKSTDQSPQTKVHRPFPRIIWRTLARTSTVALWKYVEITWHILAQYQLPNASKRFYGFHSFHSDLRQPASLLPGRSRETNTSSELQVTPTNVYIMFT